MEKSLADNNLSDANDTETVSPAPEGNDLAALIQGALGSDPFAAVAEMLAGARTDLATTRYEGTAGGGVVHVVLNGEKRLTAVSVAQEVLASGDASLIEELIVAAASDAFDKADALQGDPLRLLDGLLGPH